MLTLSIVVPVYNTEKFLKRCIDSILCQTLTSIEVIIVNDASLGNVSEIIEEYSNKDGRVRYVAHEQNRGLFQARLTGAALAQGEYISFVDSDDFLSMDYFRTLIQRSRDADNSDVVVGRTVHLDMDGNKYILPFHDHHFESIGVLCADDIKKRFFNQQGHCYGWHTIWNKTYKKTLWDKCEPYYHYIQQHLILTEDVAFSVPLLYFAKSLSSVQSEAYFYCENEGASTNVASVSMQRFTKNIEDMKLVFDFVEWFLDKVEAENRYKDDFGAFRKHYARLWQNFASNRFLGNNKKEANEVLERLLPGYAETILQEDDFYGRVRIPWNGGLEYLKTQIATSPCKYISFDVFDTLVKRPFYNPDDIFYLMDKTFQTLVCGNISFHKIRRASEDAARFNLYKSGTNYQDCNLSEIYAAMQEEYGISAEAAKTLMEEEIRLELEFITPRNAARELYEVAKACSKKILIISDMYLNKRTMVEILNKCNYKEYEHLFVSSEARVTKHHSGELFAHVLKELKISAAEVLHIGDTWQSDITNAQAHGMQAIFFPKAKDIFEGKIDNGYNYLYDMELACGMSVNYGKTLDSVCMRIMLGIVCNSYFDNPYRTTYIGSKYNADPYLTGYFPVGMHLAGLCKWMFSQAAEHGYSRIAYLARDGHLPILAHKTAAKYMNNLPKAEYYVASRKSVMPLMMQEQIDFYDMPIEITNHTAETLLDNLSFCMKNISEDEIAEVFKTCKFLSARRFSSQKEYKTFVEIFFNNFYDKEKHMQKIQGCKKYFSAIDDNETVTFDLGYSGRIQAAINRACENKIPVFFVHGDEDRSFKLRNLHGFAVHSFYNYTPMISGLIREHLFSDALGSCTGYEIDGTPIIEEKRKNPADIHMVQKIHQGALDFCDEFFKIYSRFPEAMDFNPQVASLPFEGFVRNMIDADLSIFSSSYFEDTVYGAVERINIKEHILRQLSQLPMPQGNSFVSQSLESILDDYLYKSGKGKVTKGLIYFLIGGKVFKERVKLHLQKRPALLHFCWRIYRQLKRK
ncbi:MAG: glycosyltransferase [Defluviitaleaceae bacterium]|nr:glycosyltransferase [Defluviitaleaceae bacterium]